MNVFTQLYFRPFTSSFFIQNDRMMKERYFMLSLNILETQVTVQVTIMSIWCSILQLRVTTLSWRQLTLLDGYLKHLRKQSQEWSPRQEKISSQDLSCLMGRVNNEHTAITARHAAMVLKNYPTISFLKLYIYQSLSVSLYTVNFSVFIDRI